MKKLYLILVLISCFTATFAQWNKKVNSASSYLSDGVKLDLAKTDIDDGTVLAKKEEARLLKAIDSVQKALDQTKALPDGKDKEKAIKKSEKEIKNAKEDLIDLSKAWLVRGKVYHSIYKSPLPKIKQLDSNALEVAYDAYNKAIELGSKAPKGYRDKDDVNSELAVAHDEFINKGVDAYNAKKFSTALASFENTLAIDNLPGLTKIDTVVIYHTGLAALNAKNYPKAIKYFKRSLELNYEVANSTVSCSRALQANKDTTASVTLLKDGIAKYQKDNTPMLIELVNFYMIKDNSSDAMKFLDLAIQKDPTNQTYFFAKGVLYDRTKDYDKAIEAYSQAIKIKPDYFDAQYNLGAVYYNKAAKTLEDADKIPPKEVERYNAEVAKAQELFKQALPFMEKAHQLDPKDISTMQSLSAIYLRLKMVDKQKEMKDLIDKAKGN